MMANDNEFLTKELSEAFLLINCFLDVLCTHGLQYLCVNCWRSFSAVSVLLFSSWRLSVGAWIHTSTCFWISIAELKE